KGRPATTHWASSFQWPGAAVADFDWSSHGRWRPQVSFLAETPQTVNRPPRRCSNRLDRAPRKAHTRHPADKLQQHEHALVAAQTSNEPTSIKNRTGAQPSPRAWREPACLRRQHNKTATFSGSDLVDDIIGDARRYKAIHHEANHT